MTYSYLTMEERNELFKQRYPELHSKLTDKNKTWQRAMMDALIPIDKKPFVRKHDDSEMKVKARKVVFVNKRNGKIVNKPCEVCSEVKTQAHHDDYSKPLEVRWLCKICHQKFHKSCRYNPITHSYEQL